MLSTALWAHTLQIQPVGLFCDYLTILRVEGGEVIGALSQAGFSGNMAKALSGRVVLGDSSIRKGSYSTGSMHVPDVLMMDGLRINPA